MKEKKYDPFGWLSNWPLKDKGLCEAWGKIHARFGLAAQRSTELETGLVMLISQLEQARWIQLPSATLGRFKRQAAVASVLLKRLSKGALWDVTRSLPRKNDTRFADS